MNKTSIEWVKNPDGTQGFTWNPITGCLNGCSYCYARKLANGRLKSRYLANKNIAIEGIKLYQREGEVSQNTVIRAHNDPFFPREWFNRREKALEGGKAKGVFVCDMSDLLGIGIPESWTECVLETIKVCPDHRFYLLTKQPQNLIKFSPFPDNCWVGVTATNHETFAKSAVELEEIEATVKYLSVEPFLDWRPAPITFVASRMKEIGIKWVIIGAQTKPYKLPKLEWVQEIVEACGLAGIPVFLKDNLSWLLPAEEPFYSFSRVSPGATEIGRLKQEMPSGS